MHSLNGFPRDICASGRVKSYHQRCPQLDQVTEGCLCVCRVKSYHQRSAQYDQILKKNEQMYALLAITTSLCPAAARNMDEAVASMLKEK